MKTDSPDRYRKDIIILGGGPAGFATAIPLAKAGLKVLLIDQQKRHVRKGEMLSPQALPVLQKLGCFEVFQKEQHAECPGIISAWGGEESFETDFINNPYGSGWFIDRVEFESMLEAKFTSFEGKFIHVAQRAIPEQNADGSWKVLVDDKSYTSRFLVFATGRGNLPGLSVGKISIDRQVGLLRIGQHVGDMKDTDLRLVVETCPEGWWYQAFYPGGQIVQALMTDPHLLPDSDVPRNDWFIRVARQLSYIDLQRKDCQFGNQLRPVPAGTYIRKQLAGHNWLVVGAAAMGLDPLSGLGITYALSGGLEAARAILLLTQGNGRGITQYVNQQLEQFDRFVHSRTMSYSREQRWPEAAYWSCRANFTLESITI